MGSSDFHDLKVWQKSMELVVTVYQNTARYPTNELYGLTSQTRRCAVSIPSNIAEGSKRKTKNDFHHFACMAYGSGAELETQLEIAKRLQYISESDYTKISTDLLGVMKMLNKMIEYLKTTN